LEEWLDDGSARRWRRQAEQTYAEASQELGVAVSTLLRWESSGMKPSASKWRGAYNYYNALKEQEDLCPPPRNPRSLDGPAPHPDAVCPSFG
jgi:transcriptional regulator with XRE-family HTH domain